jgi:hypothetical protein
MFCKLVFAALLLQGFGFPFEAPGNVRPVDQPTSSFADPVGEKGYRLAEPLQPEQDKDEVLHSCFGGGQVYPWDGVSNVNVCKRPFLHFVLLVISCFG